jgi:cyclopropane-fatty-acyl-phospholipid synthase
MTVSASVSSPEIFRRIWEVCLAHSEAGFHSGYLGVSQLAMTGEPVWS